MYVPMSTQAIRKCARDDAFVMRRNVTDAHVLLLFFLYSVFYGGSICEKSSQTYLKKHTHTHRGTYPGYKVYVSVYFVFFFLFLFSILRIATKRRIEVIFRNQSNRSII